MKEHGTNRLLDEFIGEIREKASDWPELLEIFENCYQNTLNTTVHQMADGTTHVITGDIPAMWLRDSAAQLRPYIFPAKKNRELQEIIAGLVRRQFFYICIDGYANAFNEEPNGACWEKDDPDQNPWVWERKFEVDSLCYPVQLAWLLWKNTGCVSQFDDNFQKGAKRILEIFRTEQYHEERSLYRFQRTGSYFQDTLSREGKGALVKSGTGLIWSGFRPSDDACTYGYLIPSNMFAVVILGYLEEIEREYWKDTQMEMETRTLREQVYEAVEKEGKTRTEEFGMIYAYETDGWEMDDIVEIPEEKDGICVDTEGNELTVQKADGIQYVHVTDIPAMGHKVILFKEGELPKKNTAFAVNGKNIETPFYSISLNDYGQITRLYDKEQEREVLAQGERGNVLQTFEDKPIDNDAWDIDIFYQQKMREITELTSFEVTQCGPLRLVIHMGWKYMNTVIGQDMILYSTDRRIDFKTDVDFHERQQLLKAAFCVDIRSTYATYDIQYGNVRRPNHWNTSWDQARFESVGHRFADLSERDYGVALLNDCKYGYDVKDNVMRISLLRSGLQPDHIQDVGRHEFTYSLLPHKGDFVEGKVVETAYRLNNPADVVKGADRNSDSFFTLDNSQVEVDAVKRSEDGKYLVVRFHDFAGSRQKVCVSPTFAYQAWAKSDLMERPTEDFRNDAVKLELHPYEIKTVLFQIQK